MVHFFSPEERTKRTAISCPGLMDSLYQMFAVKSCCTRATKTPIFVKGSF